METNKTKDKRLISIVGVIAATILYAVVPKYEGVEQVGYLDPVGIPTKCMGDTNDVVVGKVYTMQECLDSLGTQLYKHAVHVVQCTPSIVKYPETLAAAVSFAYNIGVNAYCNSGTARAFREGNLLLGCKRMNENAMGKPQWVTAKGKVLKGLVIRRAEERALCEKGITNTPLGGAVS